MCVYAYPPTRCLNCDGCYCCCGGCCRLSSSSSSSFIVATAGAIQSSAPTFPPYHIRNEINQIEFKIDEPCAANFIENSNCRMWQWQWLRQPYERVFHIFHERVPSIMFRWQTMFFVNVRLYVCVCDHNCD